MKLRGSYVTRAKADDPAGDVGMLTTLIARGISNMKDNGHEVLPSY